jgi:predicted DNA-binding transcriptional regulator AlpA
MAIEFIPVAVSTKKLCALFDLTRQRINELEKDPESEFPEPSRIGRSVRHNVQAVAQWFESKKRGRPIILREALQGYPPAVSIKVANPVQYIQPSPKPKPFVAEVDAANAKVLAATPREGQRCVESLIETADGVMVKFVQLIPRHCDDPEPLSATHKVVRRQAISLGLKPIKELETTEQREKSEASTTPPKVHCDEPKPSFSSLMVAGYHRPIVGRSRAPVPAALKQDYESGLSLDALCKRYHLGKSNLSTLLRDAGVPIRKPGRFSKPSVASTVAEVK